MTTLLIWLSSLGAMLGAAILWYRLYAWNTGSVQIRLSLAMIGAGLAWSAGRQLCLLLAGYSAPPMFFSFDAVLVYAGVIWLSFSSITDMLTDATQGRVADSDGRDKRRAQTYSRKLA